MPYQAVCRIRRSQIRHRIVPHAPPRHPRLHPQQHQQGDGRRPLRGLFALRSPRRPNAIGLTVVRLLRVEGNALTVAGLDAWDGTLVLDIKPHG